jgi:hypothetical protein
MTRQSEHLILPRKDLVGFSKHDAEAMLENLRAMEHWANKAVNVMTLPGFGYKNLAASQTDLEAQRVIADATPVGRQQGVIMPWDGQVQAFSWMANGSKTAGTCTFSVYRGTTLIDSKTWADGTSSGYGTVPLRTAPEFSEGAELKVKVTTNGSFAPTTLDIEVTLFVIKRIGG